MERCKYISANGFFSINYSMMFNVSGICEKACIANSKYVLDFFSYLRWLSWTWSFCFNFGNGLTTTPRSNRMLDIYPSTKKWKQRQMIQYCAYRGIPFNDLVIKKLRPSRKFVVFNSKYLLRTTKRFDLQMCFPQESRTQINQTSFPFPCTNPYVRYGRASSFIDPSIYPK